MTRPPTLLEAAAALRDGRTTAVELTGRALDRTARLDPSLHAFATVLDGPARARAAAADDELRRGVDRGPLHGIPVGVKDLIAVAGVPMGAGMPLRAELPPSERDAEVVRRLRAAGAVVVGTLRMTEGAYFEHHPDVVAPRNPWGPDRLWPGASSSGPAVAVAAGLVFAALGSDTGGSIRFPAAANRVVGLKPTRGAISLRGTFPAAHSLDHLGVFTRAAGDAAAVLAAVGPATGTGTGTDGPRADGIPADGPRIDGPRIDGLRADGPRIDGLRVGVDGEFAAGADGATRRALASAAAGLAERGATVVDVRVPDTTEARAAWTTICATEAAYNHRDTYPARAAGYGPLAGFLDAGRATTGTDLVHALRVRDAFTARLTTVFDAADVLLVPTQPDSEVTLARKDAMIADPGLLGEFVRYAVPFSLTGHPTLTVPAHTGGTWTSVQLVAGHGREPALFAVGRALPGPDRSGDPCPAAR